MNSMNTLLYIEDEHNSYEQNLIERNREQIQSMLIEQGRILRDVDVRDIYSIQQIAAGDINLLSPQEIKRILRSYSNEELICLCQSIPQIEELGNYSINAPNCCEAEWDEEACNYGSEQQDILDSFPAQPRQTYCEPDTLQEALRLIKQLEYEQRLSLLGEMLDETILNQLRKQHTPDVVKIYVDNHWRILSRDADIEVKMPTLSKVLYFLFLRHPEGIVLKQISNYRDELLKIYLLFSPARTMQEITKSIDILTDVSDGSLNQKISRVNAAFQSSLSYSNTWQITGKRGDVKRIESADIIEIPERLRTLN